MKPYKELLFKKHNLFDRADTDEQRKLFKMEIKSIIEEQENPDAQDMHILGLAYYNTSEDDLDIKRSNEYFSEALAIDDSYNMARLYFGHCFHDLGEFSDALENYLLVDGIELVNEFALWRYVKLQEQIGFCYHKLGRFEEANCYFEIVLGFYQREDYECFVDPVEVFQCLDENNEIFRKLKEIESTYYQR